VDDNKRRYFRHRFYTDLCGEIKIVQIGNEDVSSKKAYICIKDIGAGGIRFESHLNLPIREDIVLSLSTKLLNTPVAVRGSIRRIIELDDGNFEYGFNFHIDEDENQLPRLINEVSVKARKTLTNTGCSLCSEKTKCHKHIPKVPVSSGT
jgi:hypothetical protein